MVSEGLIEKGISEQRFERSEKEGSSLISGRENSGCKGPEAGTCLTYLKDKKASVAGAELARERVRSEKLGTRLCKTLIAIVRTSTLHVNEMGSHSRVWN